MSTRKLTVRSCEVKYDPPDKDWTLYEVAVVDEAGEPIMEEFKSFANLPLNTLTEYEVERQDHPAYGTSFLLKLPRGTRAAPRPNTQAALEDLRQRVARLESQVGGLTGTPTTPQEEEIPF